MAQPNMAKRARKAPVLFANEQAEEERIAVARTRQRKRLAELVRHGGEVLSDEDVHDDDEERHVDPNVKPSSALEDPPRGPRNPSGIADHERAARMRHQLDNHVEPMDAYTMLAHILSVDNNGCSLQQPSPQRFSAVTDEEDLPHTVQKVQSVAVTSPLPVTSPQPVSISTCPAAPMPPAVPHHSNNILLLPSTSVHGMAQPNQSTAPGAEPASEPAWAQEQVNLLAAQQQGNDVDGPKINQVMRSPAPEDTQGEFLPTTCAPHHSNPSSDEMLMMTGQLSTEPCTSTARPYIVQHLQQVISAPPPDPQFTLPPTALCTAFPAAVSSPSLPDASAPSTAAALPINASPPALAPPAEPTAATTVAPVADTKLTVADDVPVRLIPVEPAAVEAWTAAGPMSVLDTIPTSTPTFTPAARARTPTADPAPAHPHTTTAAPAHLFAPAASLTYATLELNHTNQSMVAATAAPMPVKPLAHVAQHVVDMAGLADLSGQQATPVMSSSAAAHKELSAYDSGTEPTVSLLYHQGIHDADTNQGGAEKQSHARNCPRTGEHLFIQQEVCDHEQGEADQQDTNKDGDEQLAAGGADGHNSTSVLLVIPDSQEDASSEA